jgi:holo-[acyl-carrier protein] synthase
VIKVAGLGFDLIDLKYFAIHYGEGDPELLARCFTEQELAAAGEGTDRLATLAGRFAVKEATFKALGGGSGVTHLDIETLRTSDGAPQIRLSGAALELAASHGIATFLVSISHSASSAGAVVIGVADWR